MDNRLSIKEFLRVFDVISSNGEKVDGQYRIGEMCAWHDFDGYTCWLGYRDVTVTLMFHGSLKIEYDNASNYSDFTHQCMALTAPNTVQ